MQYNYEVKVTRLRELEPISLADTPEKVVEFWKRNVPSAGWFNPDVECAVVFYLNTRRWIHGFSLVATGTLDTLLIHPREVYRGAIVQNSAAILIAHNHPSGNPQPSEGDIKVTRELIRAGTVLKIELLDHLVIGRPHLDRAKDYASLKEMGFWA